MIGTGAGIYSLNLGQKNPETIFLTADGQQEYQNFTNIVPERKTLIVKIEFDSDINNKTFDQLEAVVNNLDALHEEEFDFMTPRNLYRNKERMNEAIRKLSFPKNTPRLLGNKFIAFLVIEKKENTSFSKVINEIFLQLPLDKNVAKIKIAGIPYTNFLLDKYSESIRSEIFPLMFSISFFIILFITRNIFTTILLFLPCLFSAIIPLAVIKFFYSTMNMITAIVPLLCFAITLALIFHIYFGIVESKSFFKTLKLKLSPIVLMIITTCIGFSSLIVAEIEAISTFGKLSSFLIFTCSLYTVAWTYCCENLFVKYGRPIFAINNIGQFFSQSLSLTKIIAMSLLSIIIGFVAVQKIKVLTDATSYFPKSSGIKESIDSVNQSVSGIPLYEILISHGNEINIEILKEIALLEKDLLRILPEIKGVENYISLNSMVENANREYSGEEKIPNYLMSYHLLRSKLKTSIFESYPLGPKYRITILGRPIDVSIYEKGLEKIKLFLQEKNKNYSINGIYYNLMIAQKVMIGVLAKSFFLALAVVGLIAFIYLKKINIFFIFIFVNIVPVFISFIFIYLSRFSINIATVMTYSIATGMIVDSSFHIIHALKNAQTFSYQSYINATLKPIIGSSMLLIISFSTFGLNDFLPIKQFGLNLAIILFIGLIFDLFVLPTLYLGHNKIKDIFNN